MTIRIVFLDRASLPAALPAPVAAHEWIDHPHTEPADTIARLAGARVAVVNKHVLDAATLAQLPDLKLVAVCATGVNNVDIDACRRLGITVCNVRNYGADSVAEHAFLLLLALKRNLLAYRTDMLAGRWQQSSQFCLLSAPITDLAGQRLLVAGSGDIGSNLAQKARAFGMEVFQLEHRGAVSVRPGYLSFDEGLASADALSLHLPLNDGTRGMIGAAELARMKPGCVLINTARGGLVDEAALVAALRDGPLAGAGFDVLSEEPPVNGNPLLDVELPNLIVTPHVAWASGRAMTTMARMLVDNIDAWLAGAPRNVVA